MRRVPPGWPDQVPPPGVADWDRAAGEWLLDLCPADYRGYPLLRRHPLVLAWLAERHVEASRHAMARTLASARADLAGMVPARVVEETLRTVEQEQASLLAAARCVDLVLQALTRHSLEAPGPV